MSFQSHSGIVCRFVIVLWHPVPFSQSHSGINLLAVSIRGVVVRGAEKLRVSSAEHVAVSGNGGRHEVSAVVLHLGTAGTGGVLTSTEKVDERGVSERVPLKHLEELRELTVVENKGEHG